MSNESVRPNQTAYERWEMASFGDSRPSALAEDAARHTALSMQNLAEVAKVKEEARHLGQKEGYSEGYTTGIAQAQVEIANKLAAISEIAKSFQKSVDLAGEEAADDILKLALDLSKTMLRTALAVKPELLLNTIKRCLHGLPFNQPLTILVNPAELLLVQTAFAQQIESHGWTVFDDARISAGGCKIDTNKNHLDASMEQRWKIMAAEVGVDTSWISDEPK